MQTMTLPAELRAEADRRVPDVNAYYHDEATRALLHRAADALEWVSVEDRLPAIDEDVLLLLDEGQSVGCRDTKGWRIGNDRYGWDWHYNLNGAEPTHWRPLDAPLPSPPGAVGEGHAIDKAGGE